MADSSRTKKPCILVGKLLVKYSGFQNQNEIVVSGLSITLKYGKAMDRELKEVTIKADEEGYFILRMLIPKLFFSQN